MSLYGNEYSPCEYCETIRAREAILLEVLRAANALRGKHCYDTDTGHKLLLLDMATAKAKQAGIE